MNMKSNLIKAVFFVLLVGLVYVSHILMIKPANADLGRQKVKVAESIDKLRQLKSAPAAIEDLRKQLAELEDGIKLLESRLPDESEIYTVLENVTVIALQQGLTPKTIRTLRPKNNNGYIEQPIKMELHGDFKSYYSFLLSLEKLDRITKIREMMIKKDTNEDGLMKASFVISIFFQNASA
jgi:type IV pilus assembly protein PilO